MSNCNNCDNRDTCGLIVPSSCVAYVGYISSTIESTLPCRPNLDDVLKQIQNLIDSILTSLGSNKTLTPGCFTFDPTTIQQVALNQSFITKICDLQTQIADLPTMDPNTLMISLNLLCLANPMCTPETQYSLLDILNKLVTSQCNLITRVTNIENFLNL